MIIIKINKYILYWTIIIFTSCFTIAPKIWYAITFSKTNGMIRHFVFSEDETGSRTKTTWYPLIDFEIKSQKISFYGSDLEHDEFDRGDIVPVIYNAKNPKDAYVYSFPGFWGPSLLYFLPVFVFASAFLLSVGFLPRILILKL